MEDRTVDRVVVKDTVDAVKNLNDDKKEFGG